MSPHRHSRPRHNSAEVDDHLEETNDKEDEEDSEDEDEEDDDEEEEEREGDDRFDVNTTLSTSAPPLATSLNSTSTSSRHPSTNTANTAHTNQTTSDNHSLLNNTSFNSPLPHQHGSASRSSHSRSMLSLSALFFSRRDQQLNPNHSTSVPSQSSMSNSQYQQQLQQQQQQQRQDSEEYAELLYRLNSYNNVYNTGNNDIHGIHHPASLSPVVSIDVAGPGRASVPLPPPADASPQSDPHSSYEAEYAYLAYAAPRNKIHHHQAQMSDDLETPYVQHEDDGEADARRSPSPGHSLHGNAQHQQSALQKSWLSKLLA